MTVPTAAKAQLDQAWMRDIMDVDPKLQTNRVADLGGTVRPSSKYKAIGLLVIMAGFTAFALAVMPQRGWRPFALLEALSGQARATPAQWLLAVGYLLLMGLGGWGASLMWRRLAGSQSKRARSRTRVDVYAPAMGHGQAVEKVTKERASRMAARLVKGWDPARMQPGLPLGVNIVDHVPMSTSWEDMAVVLAGPRSGKSLCYAVPAVLSAPGACVATSNKGDILDATRPVREHDHPDARIWVFDPERIADPQRKGAPWVWNLIDSVQSIADAKRIADCWRYASGQPQTGGDDFFPGTAAQQLADYLFAAHLGGRTVADVFRWASNERNTEPVTILQNHAGYREIASRVSSVIALTPETRSGVFGSLQTMCAFLADPDLIDWIQPRDHETRPVFDPRAFATSEDTLYLLSAQGRPSTALTASLTAVTPGGFDDDTLFAAIVDPHEPHAAQAVEQAVQHGIEDPNFQPDLQRINHAADMLTDIAEHMRPGFRSDLHATAAYIMIVGNRREEASQQIEKAFIDNPSNDLAGLEQQMLDFDVTAAWAKSDSLADRPGQAPTINDDDQHARGR